MPMRPNFLPRPRRGPLVLLLVALLAALVSVGTPSAEAGPPATGADTAATGTPLRNDTGLYPRAVRLAHNGDANGRVLASVVAFRGGDGIAPIHESTDGGATFTEVGAVADPEAAGGQGLCCGTLYELPSQVGDLRAGTLLWSASVGQDEPDRRMALRVFRSDDVGRTWSYLSTIATAANDRGSGSRSSPSTRRARSSRTGPTRPTRRTARSSSPPAPPTASPGPVTTTPSPAPSRRTGRGCPSYGGCPTARTS